MEKKELTEHIIMFVLSATFFGHITRQPHVNEDIVFARVLLRLETPQNKKSSPVVQRGTQRNKSRTQIRQNKGFSSNARDRKLLYYDWLAFMHLAQLRRGEKVPKSEVSKRMQRVIGWKKRRPVKHTLKILQGFFSFCYFLR